MGGEREEGDGDIPLVISFSHLADALIQSDLQGCIHIFYIYTDGTPHQEQLGVQCLAQGRFDRESN